MNPENGTTETKTLKKNLKVQNEAGLHLRKASALSQVMSSYRSSVLVRKSKTKVDAKSAVQLLMLEARIGTILTFIVVGHDAEEAMEAAIKFFEEAMV